ncbi:gamma-glutamylputrescine oxidase [Rhodopseudomonas julia]|uniref:Gamma-glutamylputrescine oxidase n=1 Tax=Rhodopseudomonas julia TaxID=200617 RepID=A0ABU0C377_9BRAD|nr:FAD-binding oxidoreductase [Rhodopseudomonas julia]MDQ0324964.1 gamma-glutamylputrescine oxidase [Rhodopseudomonas julia]
MPRPFPPSWYHLTAGDRPERQTLSGKAEADICVIGGGLAGLSAALHLAEAGTRVVLLEADRLGYGASGRNGGQIHSGQRRDILWLEKHYGFARAKALWQVGEEAKALVRSLAARFGCKITNGLIDVFHRPADEKENAHFVETLRERYDYPDIEVLSREAAAEAVGSPSYYGGCRDRGAGHLDPYAFLLGLAGATEAAGASLFEDSPALSYRKENGRFCVQTPSGEVTAERLIVTTNGRSGPFEAVTRGRTVGVNSFMVATEPLGDLENTVLPGGECASDSYFVICYWRKSADGRLLFGGGESSAGRIPSDIGSFVRPHFLRVYPQLKDIKIAHGWGGVVSITPARMPFIREIAPGVMAAAGFSGQGVALAPYVGKLLAEEALGRVPQELALYTDLKVGRVPGITALRRAMVSLAIWHGQLVDRF